MQIILERNSKQLCKVLKVLADTNNHPVLLNCSHGKDRTGVTVAVLLRCLGVSKEDIAQDYHISERHGRTPEAKAIFHNHSPLLTLDVWTRAPAAVMHETLEVCLRALSDFPLALLVTTLSNPHGDGARTQIIAGYCTRLVQRYSIYSIIFSLMNVSYIHS